MRRKASVGAALLACALGTAQAAEPPDRSAGRRLFTAGTVPSCATCHTLRDAQSAGEIGPVLDELKPTEERVANAVRNGLGVMPAFADKLSAADIALLARYVSQSAAAKP